MNKDVVYTHDGILLSHKKNEILSSATEWKYLEGIRLCEISKRKRNTVWFHLHVESRKTKQMNKHNKMETAS